MIMNVEKGMANELKGWFFFFLLAWFTDSLYLCCRNEKDAHCRKAWEK